MRSFSQKEYAEAGVACCGFDAIEAVQVAAAVDGGMRICSSASGAVGQPLRFVLFLHAGERLSGERGYHFDPLIPVSVLDRVEIADDELPS